MAKAINFQTWFKQINEQEIKSLYLVSGEEDFLIKQGVKVLIEKCIAPACESLDLMKFNGLPDRDKLLAEVNTVSFMSPKRLIILQNSGLFNSSKGSTEEKRALLDKLSESLHEQVCLCLVEEKVDKRLKKSFAIFDKVPAEQVEVPKLDAPELLRWISAYLGKKDLRISKNAAESLIMRCDSALSDLSLELDKLSKYCQYANLDSVDYDMIELCCREDLQGNIFKLIDAVSAQRSDQAMLILDRLVKQKEPLILILFMLARHFRQLLCSKDARTEQELSKKLKVPYFVAGRLLRQNRVFSRKTLWELCELCQEADYAIKTGLMEERLAVEMILLQAGSPSQASA